MRTTVQNDGRVAINSSNIYTMRELNQNTARVMEQINASGEPAAITRHGRFVALITPLADVAVETLVLKESALANEIEERATDGNDAHAVSSEELLNRLAERHGK